MRLFSIDCSDNQWRLLSISVMANGGRLDPVGGSPLAEKNGHVSWMKAVANCMAVGQKLVLPNLETQEQSYLNNRRFHF